MANENHPSATIMIPVPLTDAAKTEISNPFFTNHSDNPGLMLISKPLNGDNYSVWRRAMTMALNSKNKLGFVNGTIKPPLEETDPDSYAAWSRCNDMVHSWIINTLIPEIADSVIYYTIAHEVWEDLRERFSQCNAPRIFEIQREITYHQQEQLSVSAYYTKLKGLWDELASYSEASYGAQQDQQKLMQFLMGLNESYSAIRGQILLMNPLPSIRQAYSSVSQEEKQRLLAARTTTDYSGSAAMAVRSHNRSNQFSTAGRMEKSDRPYNSSHENRRHDQDKRRLGSSRGRPQCFHCRDMGHFIDTCYQLHGYPPGHPKARQNTNKNQSRFKSTHMANCISASLAKDAEKPMVTGISEAQLQQLLSLLSKCDTNSEPQAHIATTQPDAPYSPQTHGKTTKLGLSKVVSHNWIINSGATDHISSSSKLFLRKNQNGLLSPVLLPSGEKANIIAKGSLPLNSEYYLRDVLCVPTFKVNLLSVSRLTKGLNCSVTFFPYLCILQDLATRKMIGLGKQRDGLYHLVALADKKSTSNSPSNNQPTCNLTTKPTDLWHSRLGHLSPSRLRFIAKNFLNISIQSNNACLVCPLTTQSRLPFNPSSISSVKAFDIIHCDIWDVISILHFLVPIIFSQLLMIIHASLGFF